MSIAEWRSLSWWETEVYREGLRAEVQEAERVQPQSQGLSSDDRLRGLGFKVRTVS